MPCRYDETPEEIAAAKKSEAVKSPEYIRIRKELDKVTALLCGVMKADQSGQVSTYIARNSELGVWWENHRKMDIEREKKILKERALSKLTEKEKEALGLI